MTNASCADCGRIVAFRTLDPSEIAECRNCGIWVKRSSEMPGVAISVKESSGPVAHKTALPPPRNGDIDEKPSNQGVRKEVSKPPSDRVLEKGTGETMTAAAVYAAIRDLQKSVHDLRVDQKAILEDQKAFLGEQSTIAGNQNLLLRNQEQFQASQKALYDGQLALHSGQKQLFGQYRELQTNQLNLFERTLEISKMPVSKHGSLGAARTGFGNIHGEELPENGFYTTPFSSLQIPLIPAKLEDLGYEPQFTEEGSAPSIPASERTSRVELIEKPLPAPPPYVEPAPIEESVAAEAPAQEQLPVLPTFQETALDSYAFEIPPIPQLEAEMPPIEEAQADPASPASGPNTPFFINEEPFTIAEPETPPVEPETKAATDSPFPQISQPFKVQEYTHEPLEMDDPFTAPQAELTEEATESLEDENAYEAASPFSVLSAPQRVTEEEIIDETIVSEEPLPEEGYEQEGATSLTQKIATAKEEQDASVLDPSQQDLFTEPQKSRGYGLVLLALLAALGAGYAYFFTDLFKGKETSNVKDIAPPLVEFPIRGSIMAADDERILEAEMVAQSFLAAKSINEVKNSILPVNPDLLNDFWRPLNVPTIERTLEGRVLANDRVEVDFIIKDFGSQERLLSVVKQGRGPFQVDWKSYAECEEVTLWSLAQGVIVLDSGEEIDQGIIRSWLQDGGQMASEVELGNFQSFRIHNFAEETVSLAVVSKTNPAHQTLVEALAATKMKHKGNPTIRVVLEVKCVLAEDTESKKPAHMEILKVISTDWNGGASNKQPLEKSSELPSRNTQNQGAPEKSEPEKESNQAVEPAPVQDALPPTPDENVPFTQVDGESPVIRVILD